MHEIIKKFIDVWPKGSYVSSEDTNIRTNGWLPIDSVIFIDSKREILFELYFDISYSSYIIFNNYPDYKLELLSAKFSDIEDQYSLGVLNKFKSHFTTNEIVHICFDCDGETLFEILPPELQKVAINNIDDWNDFISKFE